MKKAELIHRLAEDEGRTPAEAADTLDDVIHGILKKLKQGKLATLPGLGKFLPGDGATFQFRKNRPRSSR